MVRRPSESRATPCCRRTATRISDFSRAWQSAIAWSWSAPTVAGLLIAYATLRLSMHASLPCRVTPNTQDRVRDIAIVDARELAMPRDTEYPTLTLVTCYPFDALVPGGPLRYVVT